MGTNYTTLAIKRNTQRLLNQIKGHFLMNNISFGKGRVTDDAVLYEVLNYYNSEVVMQYDRDDIKKSSKR